MDILISYIFIKDDRECNKRIYKHENSIEIPIVVRDKKIEETPR